MLGFSMHSFMSNNDKLALIFWSTSFKSFLNLDRDYLFHHKYYTNALKFCQHFVIPLTVAKLKTCGKLQSFSMLMIVSMMYWWNKHTEPTVHFMAQCIYCNHLLEVSVHSCEYRASPFLGHSSHLGPQALMESSSIQQHMDLEICMARALEQWPRLYSRKQLPRLVSVRNSINIKHHNQNTPIMEWM